MTYTQTLDLLLGWIGVKVRVAATDADGQPLLVLTGRLGRAPDASDTSDEAIFFCVGPDEPHDNADGFFIPEGVYRHAVLLDAEADVGSRLQLVIAFENATALLVTRLA